MPLAIPGFPDFREPLISDADIFLRTADEAQPVISEHTLTNVYVWRDTYDFRLSMLNGNICILAQRDNEAPFFLPPLGTTDLPGTFRELASYLHKQGHEPLFCRVPEGTAQVVLEAIPGSTMEADENNADYIYLASDLANLPGRKYHKKKNHLARFRESQSFEYRPLTPDLIPGARALQCAWCDVRGCFTPEYANLAREHQAILETLDNFDRLRAVGGVILIGGEVKALTIGEPLNKDTFVIHFEKADQSYQGIYQMINQQFCQDISKSYQWVNREQDLGEPGLRQAKQSYKPHHLLMKYNVRIPL